MGWNLHHLFRALISTLKKSALHGESLFGDGGVE